MNCECIYYNKKATRENLMNLAKVIAKKGEECEIDPVTISVITKDTRACDDYDGYGRTTTIRKGTEVLFVYGKYHYMTKQIEVDGITFRSYYPMECEDFFEDVVDF